MNTPDDSSDSTGKSEDIRTQTWGEYLPRLFNYIAKGCVGLGRYLLGAILLLILLSFFWSSWSAFGCIEQDIRLAGWLFQLIGFVQVANGLRTTEREFGKPSTLERAKNYFSNFPTRTVRNTIIAAGGGSIVAKATASGVGFVTRTNPTLEQRVEDIENAVDQLKKTTGELKQDLSREKSRLDAKINQNVGKLRDKTQEIEKRLENLMVGTIHVEWLGVALFVVGITLASLSPEIASLLGHPSSCR